VLLRRRIPGGPTTWSTGSALAYIDQAVATAKLIVGVRCRIATLEYDERALLDTACTWSVLSSELADELTGAVGAPSETVSFDTRLGSFSGGLHRIPIQLVADDGDHLDVDATVAILPEWPGPTVLGFHGFIERIRLAFDPGSAEEEPTLFFGKP
jgi:hypothetical protein